jgi:outer membrane receptor protein involved in Fe transport
MRRGLLSVLFAASSAFAQAPAGGLGEVVLFGEENVKVQSATKTEIPISRAPASVTVITAKQIKETEARTLGDLLRLVAGVNVRWNPMVQTIDVRGFGQNPFSNRILILIDGVPINSLENGGFPLSPALDIFPLENVKRVEVVRGPGSALYGENAFWGVISIVTYSGEDLAGGKASFLGGDRHTLWGGAQWGQRYGDLSVLASGRVLRSQLPTEFWLENDSKIKASDVYVKAAYKGFSAAYYRHDDRLDGFREDFGEAGFPPGSAFASADPLKQSLDVASLRYESPKGKPFSVSADFGYSGRKGMHCGGCHAASQRTEYRHRADHGYTLTGDVRLGIHTIASHDILVGVEARKLDPGDHKDELAPEAPVTSGYDKAAVYVQDQISLFGGKASVVAGLRYDAESKLFGDQLSPRLAVVVNPARSVVLRASWGTAFRFPSFSELYQNSWFLGVSNEQLPIPAFPLAVFTPNPGLQPEEIRTFDLGTEVQLTPRVSAKLDLYHSTVKRFMVVTFTSPPPPAAPGLRIENHPDDATIKGAELELRTNVANVVTGFVSYAYQTESREDDLRDPTGQLMEFVYAPKHKVTLGAYFGPFAGVRGSVEAAYKSSYVGPQIYYLIRSNFTDPSVHPLPGYTLLDAKVSWEVPLEVGGKRPVRLSLYGSNLLDKRPEETLIGVAQELPGREFFGRIEVSF